MWYNEKTKDKGGFFMSENQETKICKYCQTEIPKKAKVCPQCRKKQGGKLKWIIIAVLAIIIIGAVAGGGEDDKPHKVNDDSSTQASNQSQGNVDESSKEKEAGKDTFSIGETAEMNNVEVTMLNYEESEGSEFNKPTEGNVFILAEFEISNNSDRELAISSVMSFEAYADDYALNYSFGAIMEKDGENQLDGSIAAGKKMKGIIGYEVPTDWKEIEIHFTDNVWSDNKFKFLIQK